MSQRRVADVANLGAATLAACALLGIALFVQCCFGKKKGYRLVLLQRRSTRVMFVSQGVVATAIVGYVFACCSFSISTIGWPLDCS